MKKIGVLSYQGSVEEHMKSLGRLDGVEAVEVKTLAALESVDAIILPGGESTTIAKLLNIFCLAEPIKERVKNGMPVWGTCAGLILLAKNIINEKAHLALMDITVRRNAYGRQLDSFGCDALIPAVSEKPVPLVFIRAPWIENVGNGVEVLCEVDSHIVTARQGNMLATSFHPELTDDLAFHKYFADMII